MKMLDHDQAAALGFATFNKQPHLCVHVPDGGFTISATTSEGKKVTFAFQPYTTDGPPQCVDIQERHSRDGEVWDNNGTEIPLQNTRLFSKGGSIKYEGDVTLMCLVIDHGFEEG